MVKNIIVDSDRMSIEFDQVTSWNFLQHRFYSFIYPPFLSSSLPYYFQLNLDFVLILMFRSTLVCNFLGKLLPMFLPRHEINGLFWSTRKSIIFCLFTVPSLSKLFFISKNLILICKEARFCWLVICDLVRTGGCVRS